LKLFTFFNTFLGVENNFSFIFYVSSDNRTGEKKSHQKDAQLFNNVQKNVQKKCTSIYKFFCSHKFLQHQILDN